MRLKLKNRRWKTRPILAFSIWAVACFSMLNAGCDPDFQSPNQIASAEGEVTLDGDPVAGARVVFVPLKVRENKNNVPMAFGTTDAKGKFELTMSNGKTGARVGQYIVLISKTNSEASFGTQGDPDIGGENNSSPEERLELIAKRVRAQQMETEPSFLKARPRSDSIFNATQDRNEMIPSLYNRNSILRREVKSIGGLAEPKFDLRTVDPLLSDSN